MSNKGFFITFEGGEGAGKSTQIKLLADHLQSQGHDIVTTREPGGTPAAEEIRDLLSHEEWGGNWSQDAELLLFFVARSMHIKDVIAPALEAGKIILCDRYIDSTRVYQGALHKIDMSFIKDLEKRVVGNYIPNITFLLDIPVETVLERVSRRGARDHYDQQDESNHQILRDGFLDLAKEEYDRFEIIDATKEIETIAQNIAQITVERLSHAV
ncbi:MAG: dTMP kinase [Pseudomonadota bacterium]